MFSYQLTQLMSQNSNTGEYIYKSKCDNKQNRIYCWVEIYLSITQEDAKTKPTSRKRKLDNSVIDSMGSDISVDNVGDTSGSIYMVTLDDDNGDAANNGSSIFDMFNDDDEDEDDNEINVNTNSSSNNNNNNNKIVNNEKIIENLISEENSGIIESSTLVNRWVCIDCFAHPNYSFDEPKIIVSYYIHLPIK
jgi:hypothetical protein